MYQLAVVIATDKYRILTFSLHSHGQTFHITTVLTSVSLSFVNDTVPVVSAGIG